MRASATESLAVGCVYWLCATGIAKVVILVVVVVVIVIVIVVVIFDFFF